MGDRFASTAVVNDPLPRGKKILAALLLASLLSVLMLGARDTAMWVSQQTRGALLLPESDVVITHTGKLVLGGGQFVLSQEGHLHGSVYKPGEEVLMAYRVQNTGTNAADKTELEITSQVFDPHAVPIALAHTLVFNKQLSTGLVVQGLAAQDLPDFAMPGAYKLDLQIHDLANGNVLHAQKPFQVQSTVQSCSQPTVMKPEAAFTKDGEAITNPSVPKGGKVYFRIPVCGLEMSHGRFNADEDMLLQQPGGRVLRSKNAFHEGDAPAYAPSTYRITSITTISVTDTAAPGEYVFQVKLTDHVSGKTASNSAAYYVP